MTKLGEWLCGLTVFFGVYGAIVTRQVNSAFFEQWMFEIQILPIVLVLLLGVYAVVTVLYRTLTFNNCEESMVELQEQIKEARTDLMSKGFVFQSDVNDDDEDD